MIEPCFVLLKSLFPSGNSNCRPKKKNSKNKKCTFGSWLRLLMLSNDGSVLFSSSQRSQSSFQDGIMPVCPAAVEKAQVRTKQASKCIHLIGIVQHTSNDVVKPLTH
jgi:hypothetical protein